MFKTQEGEEHNQNLGLVLLLKCCVFSLSNIVVIVRKFVSKDLNLIVFSLD